MATFDQLPADQRAIIELLLKRGRSYDALSDMLDMPESRVRELARDALTELAPRSAGRVDPDWRDQVADYALGQQSGPESTATQGHLKRSEPARAWLLSITDSLDHLYTDTTRPDLPDDDGDRPRARERKERGSERERKGRERGSGAAAAAKSKSADRERDRDDKDAKKDKTKRPSALSGGREGGPLSPAARAVVMRRRLIFGGVALVLLVLLVLQLTGNLFGGDDDKDSNASTTQNASTDGAPKPQTQLIGQLQLDPVGKQPKDTIGVAAIAKTGDKFQLALQAKLPPVGTKEAYEVWLYNSKSDAVSIGAQKPDAEGNYQGAGDIPADYAKYKFIDVSLEKIDEKREHGGDSVLRGALANLQAPQQGGTGGAAPGTGGAAPGGGAAPAPAP